MNKTEAKIWWKGYHAGAQRLAEEAMKRGIEEDVVTTCCDNINHDFGFYKDLKDKYTKNHSGLIVTGKQ